MTWERLVESEIKESRSMLPARMVLDYDEREGNYRTFLETLPKGREPGFQYGRFYKTEDEALEDFQKRVDRL